MAEQSRCAACGRAVAAVDRFCSACGARLDGGTAGELEERKLVSAVCVDLVDYTGLSETLDPEDARRLLDAYWHGVRGEIERFGGTVEKYIGDAVVGLFGAPQAHEDDAERAVRAALAIRDRPRDPAAPRLRVAVATGVALVHVAARPEAGEALVVGDVVTTATRLQQHAPPDAVLVDEPTHAATADAVRYRRVAPVSAKGKRDPVPAWRALELRAAGARSARRPRFVGRRRELSLLRTLLTRVRADRSVGLVTVLGEPGIGKSRLVRELTAPGVERWEARAQPYGEGGAFSPLAELVRSRAGIRPGDDEPAARERLDRLLVLLLPDAAERERVEPHVRRLVGLEPAPPDGAGALESYAAWRRLLEAAAVRTPLLLVLEDAHWADEAMLDFLEHLVEWAGPVPLLVLCTARSDLLRQRPGWGRGTANALSLSLAPLPDDETARLAADVLGREPDAGERAALLARAGGNPLYAEQLARMLREGGALADEVPGTVHAVIAARLDRLPAAAKQLLHDASVVGLSFPAGALAALGGRPEEEVVASLQELARLELVERRQHEDEWAFRHRLVREVAYAELPRAHRAERHAGVAAWLESRPRPEELAAQVAHHYLRAREEAIASGAPAAALERQAGAALERAAERALGLSAFASAARLYGQALDLRPAGEPGRAALLLRWAHALWSAEVSGEAVALEARDGLLAAGDVDGAAEAETLLSEMRWYRGDRAAAAEHLRHAVELVAPRPPSPAKASVLSRLARSHMLAARYPEAVASGREALALAERLGSAELQAESLNSIGSARARSGDAGGLADLSRAVALASGTRAAVVAYNNLAALLLEAGDWAGSREAVEQGRALAAQLGDRLHLEWFDAEDVSRLVGEGRWDDALAAADRWLASTHHSGYATIGVRATRGFLLHARGDDAAALDDLARAERDARAAGDPQTIVPTLAEAAFVLLEQGRPEEARVRATEVLALCERTGDVPPLALFDLAVVCCDCGLEEPLRRCLDAASAASRWLELARRYASGELERALELVAGPDGAWLTAYLRLRSAERGGAGLDEALAYYRSVEATRYVRRCELLLARAEPAPAC